MITIPNLLTLARACAVPAFILLFDQPGWAVSLFVGAMITDAFDGILARRAHMESTIGAILDPVADKLMLVSAFVMLTRHQAMPMGWLTLVLGRDLFIITGWTLVYMVTQRVMMPSWTGKVANVSQTCVVLTHLLTGLPPWLVAGCAWAMLLATTGSWVEYAWRGTVELWSWHKRPVPPPEEKMKAT